MLDQVASNPSPKTWHNLVQHVNDKGGLDDDELETLGSALDAWPNTLWRLCPPRWLGHALQDGTSSGMGAATALCNAIEVNEFTWASSFPGSVNEAIGYLLGGNTFKVADEVARAIVALPLPKLRSLSLGSELTGAGVTEILRADLPQLVHLEVGVADAADMTDALGSPELERLISLSIRTAEPLVGIQALDGRSLPSLRNLALHLGREDEALAAFRAVAPQVEHMAVQGAASVPHAALWHESLHTLDVSHNYLGSGPIKKLFAKRSWPKLKRLDLAYNKLKGAPLHKAIRQAAPGLELLAFEGSPQFTANTIDEKVIAELDQMESLRAVCITGSGWPADPSATRDAIVASERVGKALLAFATADGKRDSRRTMAEVFDRLEGTLGATPSTVWNDDLDVPLQGFRRIEHLRGSLHHVIAARAQ